MARARSYHVAVVALLVVCSLFAALPAMAQEETTYSRDDISQAKYGYNFADLSAETAGQVQDIYNRQPFPSDVAPEDIHTREQLAEEMYGGSYEESTLPEELTREQLLAVQNAYDAQFGALPEEPAHTRDDISQAMFGYDFADLSTETAGQVQAIYNRQPFVEGTELSELRTREQIAEELYGTEYDSLDDAEKRVAVENRYASQFADDEATPPAEETPSETDTPASTPTDTETETPTQTETPEQTDTDAPETETATATATATDSPTATATATATETQTATATATDSPTATESDSGSGAVPDLTIVEINAEKEYVVVRNDGTSSVDLGTIVIDYDDGQDKQLPSYTLNPGEEVTIGTGDKTTVDADIDTGYKGYVLNNDETDTVRLYTDDGSLIDELEDGEETTSLLGGFFSFVGDIFNAVGSFFASLF